MRGQLRVILLAWVFGAFWLWTINGAAFTQFARSIGTPDWAFGLITALPAIGALFQLPSSMALARWGRRRRLFLVLVSLGRAMWLLAALVPWVLPESLHWPVLLVCLGIGWAAMSAGTPAWMDWMADVIPTRLRGRFFARRLRLGQIMGLIATVGVGLVMDVFASQGAHMLLLTTSTIIGVAGLMGVLDILAFLAVPDDEPPPHRERGEMFRTLSQPLRDRDFRWFLAFNFCLILSLTFVGQYIWLFAFDVVGMTNWQANLLLLGMPLMLMAVSYSMWGGLIDRLGKKPVLIVAGFFVANGAWGWLLIGEGGGPVIGYGAWSASLLSIGGYAICMLAMVCFPGVELTSFNLLLGLAGTKHTVGGTRRAGGAYVAVNAVVVAVAGITSGLLASLIAGHFREMAYVVPVVGLTLTYHGLLLLISTVGRLIAVLFLLPIHEPKAVAVRDAFRHITSVLYANARGTFVQPVRIAGRVARWTYRLNGKDEAP